eukprot:CAMPEP_0113648300 /NCGR_PEP_ID=MMETSP0017_2-20120614/25614_1 /TAXON_ID=2856 /ORGANISM="Cylindrotheca closterium" /LENGTH=537 /DNA_ID=CAMNT_0000560501 /DNA_START=171 /DNA_END=1784 /DNA_ORIENTATION=- /assembly_acc=CAM_ASM_000147
MRYNTTATQSKTQSVRSFSPKVSTPTQEDDEKNNVKNTRKMWESRASTGSIGTKLKNATFGTAKTVVGGTIGATKTVAKGTFGATKTVAKGTLGATKTVVGGTIGATKTVAKGTLGATKTVAKGTFGATKTVGKGAYGATKTAGKSARQAIEDVAIFASPRVVQKKLNIGRKSKIAVPAAFQKNDDEKKEERPAPIAIPKAAGFEAAKGGEKKAGIESPKPVPRGGGPNKGPKHMTISERARAYEAAMNERAKKFDIVPGAPGAPAMKMHGKRTSRLDKFTPVANRRVHQGKVDATVLKAPFLGNGSSTGQQDELSKSDRDEPSTKAPTEQTLSPTTVGSCVSEDDDAAAAATEAVPPTISEEGPAEPVTPEPEAPEPMEEETTTEKEGGGGEVEVPVASDTPAEKDPARDSKKASSRIDRDSIILQEIDEIIRLAEETEIYDEIDDETIEILKESALKSKAYTKRWYDAYTDSFIHCPSLAQTIVDYTLLEIAEDKFQELYEEEFPMLYTVGLRGVACNMVGDEEEIPDYIYDMAM